MLQHIVFFKLKNVFSEEKEDTLKEIQGQLLGLKSKINGIENLECGINISTRPVAYDLALFVSFKNEKDLEYYQNHPEHIKVLEFLKSKHLTTAVVDYIKV